MIMEVEIVTQLPQEDCGLQHSIVRFHNGNIDSKRKDRSRFFRREPLIIRNPENGARVLRYAMGNPGTLSIVKKGIAVDYDAVDVLGVRFNREVKLEVRRASSFEIYRWFWQHPDMGIRLSIRLGVMGGVLGVMGFLVGIMGVAPLLLG